MAFTSLMGVATCNIVVGSDGVGDNDELGDGTVVGFGANVVVVVVVFVRLELAKLDRFVSGHFRGRPTLRLIGCSGGSGGVVGCWKGKFVSAMSDW